MKLYHNILIVPFIIIISSCVEEFNTPEIESSFQRLIVVDGGITNESKTHEITLSYTRSLNDNAGEEMVSGATVFITNSQGTIINFNETAEGIYSSPEGFSGVNGESYQLFFNTPDGGSYESSPLRLNEAPPIDSIYQSFESIITEDNSISDEGIQFFVDSQSPSETEGFFRYEWEQTYLLRVPFPSLFILDNDNNIVVRGRGGPNDVSTCYVSESSSELIVANTLSNEENRISEFPVNFVSSINTDVLIGRYSILVKQFALNRENHDYYRDLRELNVNGGSLFDQQVGNLVGNITSINNPSEAVLGYFEVAGVSELRAFFDPSDYEEPFRSPRFRVNCDPDKFEIVPESELPDRIFDNGPLRIRSPMGFFGGQWQIVPARCSDCTVFPTSTNVRPDFWID